MKKNDFCNENQWNWVVFLNNNDEYFDWGPIFYVLYVVLQGIGSLSCIRVYIILRNSFWGVATLDV